MTALKLRLVGRSDQPLFKWQTTNAEAKRVSEGLPLGRNRKFKHGVIAGSNASKV